jgi:predicted ATPase
MSKKEDNNVDNMYKIKSFEIKKLFGTNNVVIHFDENVKIVIGENGTGKTTVLNAFYYTLSCQFHKLFTIDFEQIILTFRSDKQVIIKSEDLKFIPDEESSLLYRIREILNEDEIIELLSLVPNKQILERHPLFRKVLRHARLSPVSLNRRLIEFIESNYDVFEEVKKIIKSEITEEIIYFPTYRRIEEDLHNLGYDSEIVDFSSNGKLIKFGMSDVKERFDRVTTDIKNAAIEGFSRVTGVMLKQLIDGIQITNDMKISIQQPEALRIVLDRVGGNIHDNDKQNIISLIDSGEIFNNNYDPLIYFIANLIKIYDQQREKDLSIKKFAEICNKYLVNKKIIYNESSVEINIIQTLNNSIMPINKLSSGEKQIVSMFSRIFLENNKEFLLLFDEPELSLSIEWQKELLPDIWKSNRCRLMFTATHSPFIFDNEFDEYATGLDFFIEEYEEVYPSEKR